MNEKEYKKALAERDTENKRINDQFTMEDQRNYSKQRVAELDKKIAEYESKNKAESKNKPASKPKTYMEEQFEKSRDNGLKMSAAYTPNLGSTESASLKDNPDFLAADNKRDEAKMQNASISENKAAVEQAENEVQDLYKNKLAELLEGDEEAAQAEADINKAVGDIKGEGKPTTPENVIDNLSKEYGISTNFTPDGKIVPTEESQWKRADMAGKLAMFGTALSCIVSAMSGGNIPPINFNKIVGVDKQYTTYLANVHQYNEAISAGVKKEAENKADVNLGNYLKDLPEKDRKIITDVTSDYEYTKSLADQARMDNQAKNMGFLIDAKAQSSIGALLKLDQLVQEGKLSKDAFETWAKYMRANEGDGNWERAMNLINSGTNAAGTIIDSAKSL